jgi:hypothetical protein
VWICTGLCLCKQERSLCTRVRALEVRHFDNLEVIRKSRVGSTWRSSCYLRHVHKIAKKKKKNTVALISSCLSVRHPARSNTAPAGRTFMNFFFSSDFSKTWWGKFQVWSKSGVKSKYFTSRRTYIYANISLDFFLKCVFFPPIPPHVHIHYVVLPPGCGRSLTFWHWNFAFKF